MVSEHITLRVSPEAFMVIYEFLYNTRLGNRNQFEKAISDLMIELENYDTETLINQFSARFGAVSVGAEFDQDGMTFKVSEALE